MSDPSVNNSKQGVSNLSAALQDLLAQLVGNVLGSQAQDKNGKPLRQVAYMQMPTGLGVDPRDYSNPWTPAGGDTLASANNLGVLTPQGTSGQGGGDGSSAQATSQQPAKPAPPQVDKQLALSIDHARRTAELVDRMLKVTNDGSYVPYEGSELISSAYEAVLLKAQGIPAPPPPPDVQAKIDAARKVLWILDDKGAVTGRKTPQYLQYQKLSSAWAQAKADFATAEAMAMTNPALGAAWPVTSASLQQNVDNAWDDWRSAGADEIENALDTIESVGGSVGAFFVSEAREIFKAWDLGLTGAVAVKTPYSEVSPSSWYDPTDQENGFTHLVASDSRWQASSQTSSGSYASSWYHAHSESTSGGGGVSFAGIGVSGSASSSSSDDESGANSGGQKTYDFGESMSKVTISFEYGLCDIYRPWLLTELFTIDGWYLPNEPANCISDGTVAGQTADDDKHYLPMVPTQFLVVRNVELTADGWGEAGDAMSKWYANASSSDQSSSHSVSGSVGFLGFGGSVSHTNTDSSGQNADSQSTKGSWSFKASSQGGTLSLDGCQIVGWVGEILPASPKVDGTKVKAAASPSTTASAQPATAGTSPSH